MSTPWTPGMQVDRYTVLGKIAIGGMAEIWLARQAGPKGFEKVVVIKRILDSYCQDEAFVEMFLDEARTAAMLNHPNVVQIYDLGEHGHAYFIAMEYLAGETVARIARVSAKAAKPLPYALAARIIADAAAGLGYAHAKKGPDGKPLNIVHRDVTPQNLIVTYEGQVKVLDFGVARAANRATKTEAGTFKGKIPYMSPEQAQGLPMDGRSDIFALGIVLYEIIGRCRLFQFDDQIVALKAVASTEPVPSPITRNPDVPEGLAQVTLKALARDPKDRYQTAQQLASALEEWLRTQPDAPGTTEVSNYMSDLFAERIAHLGKVMETVRAAKSGVNLGTMGTAVNSAVSMPGSRSIGSEPRPRWLLPAIGAGALAVLVIGGWLVMRSPAQPVVVIQPAAVIPASLAIETEPAAAIVTVDGKVLGPSPVVITEIAIGTHTVGATAADRLPSERIVKIERLGERTNLTLTLTAVAVEAAPIDAGVKAPPKVFAKGKLSIVTTPWSHVFEGTRALGDTPLVDLPLSAGKHSLKLVNDDKGLTKTIVVEIKANETTVVREKL